MKDQSKSTMPVVEADPSPYRRKVNISNIFEMDGVSGYAFYNPDNPPYEVEMHGGGGSLDMDEAQTRELTRRLNEEVAVWDAQDNAKKVRG